MVITTKSKELSVDSSILMVCQEKEALAQFKASLIIGCFPQHFVNVIKP